MIKIRFVSQAGAEDIVLAEEGVSIMAVAVKRGVPGIEGACGGSQVCGTCHAYIDEPWLSALPPRGDVEQGMIDFAIHARPNSRLTCQIKLSSDLDGIVIRQVPMT